MLVVRQGGTARQPSRLDRRSGGDRTRKIVEPILSRTAIRSFRRNEVLQSGWTEAAQPPRSPEMAVRRRPRPLAARLCQVRSRRRGLTPRWREGTLRVTMVGHATLLIQARRPQHPHRSGLVRARLAASFVGPKRVNAPGIAFADLPPIDVVLVSHNHYDHLDLATLARLRQAHRSAGRHAARQRCDHPRRRARKCASRPATGATRSNRRSDADPHRAGASLVGARHARPAGWRCGAASSSRRRRAKIYVAGDTGFQRGRNYRRHARAAWRLPPGDPADRRL